MRQLEKAVHVSPLVAATASSTIYVFGFALVVQTFHLIEHAAQVYQHAILGLSVPESQGILWFLDLEWNHFIFNSAYFALLAVVFMGSRFYTSNWSGHKERLAVTAFGLGFLVQGYHVVEHAVRMVQLYQTGCTPCPGILGQFFDGIYLHATLNTIVYLLPLTTFMILGFHSRLLKSAR